jgi:uncharacterized membrane protein
VENAATQKDVVLAVLGAAAALAGLVLVFLGVVIAAYQAFPGDSASKIPGRYRVAATWTLSVFTFSLITVALALAWLLTGGSNATLYSIVAIVFIVQLASTTLVAARITRSLMDGLRWR